MSDYWCKENVAFGKISLKKKKKKSGRELTRGKGMEKKKTEKLESPCQVCSCDQQNRPSRGGLSAEACRGAVNGPFICERWIILNKLQSTFTE